MGYMRFWRRIKIAPGVTLNAGKSGLSVSLGPRGAKHTIGKRGRRTTVGLPGTGLSYTSISSRIPAMPNLCSIRRLAITVNSVDCSPSTG
jgi:hypothetical protein